METYLKLARHLGCPVDSIRLELATTPQDEAAADRAFAALGLIPGESVVCLNTGGAFGPAKNWPTSHFAVLARRLAEESGARILVLCGPSERDTAREIVRSAAASPGRQPGGSGARDRLDEGLRPPRVAPDHDRFRTPPLRRRLRDSRRDPVRTDSHRLDPDSSSPGVACVPSRALRTLSEAGLSRGTSPLHA